MVKNKPKTTDEIFHKVGDAEKEIAEGLRVLVKATVPKAMETVRLGRITYTINGKDFAAIRPTKGHVDLLFMGDRSLSSPHLKGQGTIKDPKHIEVTKLRNLDENDAKRLLKEATATA